VRLGWVRFWKSRNMQTLKKIWAKYSQRALGEKIGARLVPAKVVGESRGRAWYEGAALGVARRLFGHLHSFNFIAHKMPFSIIP